MFTLIFWKRAFERAVKTGAQFVIFAWGVASVGPDEYVNAFDFDWTAGAGAFLGGVVLSVLFSIGSEPFGPDNESPSVTK